MRVAMVSATAGFIGLLALTSDAQVTTRTLVAVWAHADDETTVGPILARYAREGVQVSMIIVTDGAQGAANSSVPRGPEIARLRAVEARCSAQALGVQPPILLGFPDSVLGSYLPDPAMLFKVTQRLHEELRRLQPAAVITWGPDGGYGHPDHRIVNSIVAQLVRAGAPGVPQRVFYASMPAEGFRAMYPDRGEPPYVVPQPSLLTVRVSFTAADFEAARRSMACHRTQYSDEVVQRVSDAMKVILNGELALSPMLPQAAANDVFQ